MATTAQFVHKISVVVPVYLGETTLPGLMSELAPLTKPTVTPEGHTAVITEVLLVIDNGPDDSAAVVRVLETEHAFVRGIWLTRNFGQHAATLAGMASSGGDWIVTMDEDGQHNPADIASMLDVALLGGSHIVYAAPTNKPPHGRLRGSASRLAKKSISYLFGGKLNDPTNFQSFRLMLGEVGRGVAAYSGSGVYLDVALGWITNRVGTAPVVLRAETRAVSGYSYRSLIGHFWRMVLSSGTRVLRLVSVLGAVSAVIGFSFAVFLLVQRLSGGDFPQGWASMVSLSLIASGAILMSLGIIAEYVGVAVNMAMGKPLYMTMSDPMKGPLGHRPLQK
jgi:glycosyltransferase involved in cell wall biosynthesis